MCAMLITWLCEYTAKENNTSTIKIVFYSAESEASKLKSVFLFLQFFFFKRNLNEIDCIEWLREVLLAELTLNW